MLGNGKTRAPARQTIAEQPAAVSSGAEATLGRRQAQGSQTAQPRAAARDTLVRASSGSAGAAMAAAFSLAPQVGLRPSETWVVTGPSARHRTQGHAARGIALDGRVYLDPAGPDPDTVQGRALLAHELAHIVQQRNGRTGPPVQRADIGAAEAEAASIANAVATGDALWRPVARLPAGHIARDADAPAGTQPQPGAPVGTQPLPGITKLSDFPPQELKKLIVFEKVPPQADIDSAYRFPFASSVKTTVNFADPIIFESSVPSSGGVQDGLKSLIQMAQRKGTFPTGSITDLAVGDAHSEDPNKSVVPGGIFRISKISHGKPASTVWVVSRVGDLVSPDIVSQGSASSPGAISSKFTNVTFAPGWNADEISSVDATLGKLNQKMIQRLKRVYFIRARGQLVGQDGEMAHYETGYEPNRIEVFDSAFDPTAQRAGLDKSIIETLLHELGHGEDLRKNGEQEDFKLAAMLDGAKVDKSGRTGTFGGVSKTLTVSGGVTEYSDVNFGEYYADSFSLYVLEPDVLKLIRPSVFNFFEKSFI